MPVRLHSLFRRRPGDVRCHAGIASYNAFTMLRGLLAIARMNGSTFSSGKAVRQAGPERTDGKHVSWFVTPALSCQLCCRCCSARTPRAPRPSSCVSQMSSCWTSWTALLSLLLLLLLEFVLVKVLLFVVHYCCVVVCDVQWPRVTVSWRGCCLVKTKLGVRCRGCGLHRHRRHRR